MAGATATSAYVCGRACAACMCPARLCSRVGTVKEDGCEASTGRVYRRRSAVSGACSGAGAVKGAESWGRPQCTAGSRAGSRISGAWDDSAAGAEVFGAGIEEGGRNCGGDEHLVVDVCVGDLAHRQL